MANLCRENGVLMYNFSYPPRMISIQRQKTSKSNTTRFCLRCYAYNDHLTDNCTKHRDYKVFSECSSTNQIGETAHRPLRCALAATEITGKCQINVPV